MSKWVITQLLIYPITDLPLPAINPKRLKQEVTELAHHFDDPTLFAFELDKLFDRYADRIRRPGQTGAPSSLLPAYKVAPPVMRQIMLTLTPLAHTNPVAALALADVLWEKSTLEIRQIAIRLLGTLSADNPTTLLTRARTWATPIVDEHILDELFEKGLCNLQSHHPNQFLDIIHEWMSQSQVELQKLGLKALLPLVQNPGFDNFPQVFRLLLPRMIEFVPLLRGHLAAVMEALATRSPLETAHFLNQVLIVSDNPGIAWVTRQVMELFPQTTQERLKETIRNR